MDRETRSKGAIPKKISSASKKRIRRNLNDQLSPNEEHQLTGQRQITPSDSTSQQQVAPKHQTQNTPRHEQVEMPNLELIPPRSTSITTLSSASIPATQPLHGFEAVQVQADVHREDVVEIEINDEEKAELEGAVGDTERTTQTANQNAAIENRAINEENGICRAKQANPSSVPDHSNQAMVTSNVAVMTNRYSNHGNIMHPINYGASTSKQHSSHAIPPMVSNNVTIATTRSSHYLPIQSGLFPLISTNANIQQSRPIHQLASHQLGPNRHSNEQSHVQSQQTPVPLFPHPPMPKQNDVATQPQRTVFATNPHLQFATQPRFTPPQGMIQINANESDGNIQRTVTDLRSVYLQRMREIFYRLNTEGLDENELTTLRDRANDYAARITKYVEDREDAGVLPASELATNQAMWEEATDLVDRIKINISTKLMYYAAGNQPNSRDVRDQERLEKIRRLQAKMEPFGGNLEQWTNFKSKWMEYFHNPKDLSDNELFMKLDEFIVPRSEAWQLISGYDRAIDGSYQDAWKELCARYDNPRRQVDAIIGKLTQMEPITDRREGYLRMYTNVNNFIHSLPRMNVDIAAWDPILVHLMEHKMDDRAYDRWLGKREPREVARLQPLIEFLIKQVDRSDATRVAKRDRSRDQNNSRGTSNQNGASHHNGVSNQNGNRSVQNRNMNQQQSTNSARVQNRNQRNNNEGAVGGAPRMKSTIQKIDKCYICDLQHKSYNCPTFMRLDQQGRINKLKERKLCANCIKPNCSAATCSLRACPNGCPEKHNRLICSLTFQPSVNAGQSASDNPQ